MCGMLRHAPTTQETLNLRCVHVPRMSKHETRRTNGSVHASAHASRGTGKKTMRCLHEIIKHRLRLEDRVLAECLRCEGSFGISHADKRYELTSELVINERDTSEEPARLYRLKLEYKRSV